LRDRLRLATRHAALVTPTPSTTRVIEPEGQGADAGDAPKADLLMLVTGEGAVAAVEAERRRIAEQLQRNVVVGTKAGQS
jgi:hypothetical protein